MRDKIKNSNPILSKTDLVKSGVIVKFNSSIISSKIKMQLKKKDKINQNDLIVNDTMNQISGLVEKSYENSKKTDLYSEQLYLEIENYLQNKTADLNQIDRFLSFELYRVAIEENLNKIL